MLICNTRSRARARHARRRPPRAVPAPRAASSLPSSASSPRSAIRSCPGPCPSAHTRSSTLPVAFNPCAGVTRPWHCRRSAVEELTFDNQIHPAHRASYARLAARRARKVASSLSHECADPRVGTRSCSDSPTGHARAFPYDNDTSKSNCFSSRRNCAVLNRARADAALLIDRLRREPTRAARVGLRR